MLEDEGKRLEAQNLPFETWNEGVCEEESIYHLKLNNVKLITEEC